MCKMTKKYCLDDNAAPFKTQIVLQGADYYEKYLVPLNVRKNVVE